MLTIPRSTGGLSVWFRSWIRPFAATNVPLDAGGVWMKRTSGAGAQWKYLYRTMDTSGRTIDFLLTARRDAAAALRFFRKAIRHHGEPEVVTIDKSGANTAALAMLSADKPEKKPLPSGR